MPRVPADMCSQEHPSSVDAVTVSDILYVLVYVFSIGLAVSFAVLILEIIIYAFVQYKRPSGP